MKKALVLTSLASLAAVSFGCAVTDYPLAQWNQSHGVIGCQTDDRFANAQQTVETWTRDLLLTASLDPAVPCPGFDPAVTLDTVGTQQARDWSRFNAEWTFALELGTSGFGTGFDGMFALAGVKNLPDGNSRIMTWQAQPPAGGGFPPFTCVGSAIDGRYGGPEGVVHGDAVSGRIANFRPMAVAIDNSTTGIGFCENIAAVSVERATAGFSTYTGFFGRSAEGRLAFTPITRREGVAEFLGGGTMNVDVKDVTFTVRGNLAADGSVTVDLLGASRNGVTYQAESPLQLQVPSLDQLKTVRVTAPSADEAARLADWALSAGLAGEMIDLSNVVVPQLGAKLPPVAIMINADTLRRYIDGTQAGTDGFGN